MSPVPPSEIVRQIQAGLSAFMADLVEAGLVTKLHVRFDDHAVYFEMEVSTPEISPAWKGQDDERN